MPAFRYTAIDKAGQIARGVMEAASEAEVIAIFSGKAKSRCAPSPRRGARRSPTC